MAYIRSRSAQRGEALSVVVDGRSVEAFAGETIATALLVAGLPGLRRTRSGAIRSAFCGMGVCWECIVSVDGRPNVRACLTPVREGMRVATGLGDASPVRDDGARVATRGARAPGDGGDVG